MNIERILCAIGTLLLMGLPTQAFEAGRYFTKVRTIVIDAGHGGKDSGALGKKHQEKDVTLKIALLLGGYIERNLPDLRVVYTRKSDKFLELYERADIANAQKADLFVSIHCNSLMKRNPLISGSETYVMGLHTAEENLNVALRENAVILMEDNYKRNYGGYDPNSPEAHIMLSMYQNAYLTQSIALANKIENQLIANSDRPTRGVKQAGFMVLRATAMPSVLVETGFMSHDEDELFIGSQKGQVYIATSIYRAVRDYVEEVESGRVPTTRPLPVYTPPAASAKSTTTTATSAKTAQPVVAPTYTPNAVLYKVQLASGGGDMNLHTPQWQKVGKIQREQQGSVFKYMVGDYKTYAEAVEAQRHWRAQGFAGAFVVAYRGSTRITIEEARK